MIVRNFVAFLQHSGGIGKTLAEMSIESQGAGDHNENIRQIVLCPDIGPAKGASNEQL
ncbi:hypothetical protein ACLB1M_24225 [Escherichia coli]